MQAMLMEASEQSQEVVDIHLGCALISEAALVEDLRQHIRDVPSRGDRLQLAMSAGRVKAVVPAADLVLGCTQGLVV